MMAQRNGDPDVESSAPAGGARRPPLRLGEPTLEPLAADPQGWLLAQIVPAEAARGAGLLSTRDGLRLIAAEREKRDAARNPPPGMMAEQLLAGHYRDATLADARSHLVSAAFGARPLWSDCSCSGRIISPSR
jgi:hypothetical protein